MKRNAERLLAGVDWAERSVLVVGYLVMTGLLLLDTLGREFLGLGLFGANIYATNVLIFAAMAGFGLATGAGRHLRPRIADRMLPAAWDPVVVRAGQAASAAVLGVIAATATHFVWTTWTFGETNQVTHLPLWPIQAALPIGFALSALRHAVYAVWPDLQVGDGEVDE